MSCEQEKNRVQNVMWEVRFERNLHAKWITAKCCILIKIYFHELERFVLLKDTEKEFHFGLFTFV